MKKKKKYSIQNDPSYVSLQNCIKKHSSTVWVPPKNIKYVDLKVNGCCSKIYTHKKSCELNFNVNEFKKEELRRAFVVDLKLTPEQKSVLQKWFNAYDKLRNIAIKNINTKYSQYKKDVKKYDEKKAKEAEAKEAEAKEAEAKEAEAKEAETKEETKKTKEETKKAKEETKKTKEEAKKAKEEAKKAKEDAKNKGDKNVKIKKPIDEPVLNTSWTYARTHELIIESKQIINNSALNEEDKIPVHIIDNAIKNAYSNFSTCLTNLKVNNISHFRLRKMKHNRETKTMDINAENFTKKGISKLGHVKCTRDKTDFDIGTIKYVYKTGCVLRYSNGEYKLYVPERVESENKKKSKKGIALDPGVRTFMSGISENEVVILGEGMVKTVEPLISKMEDAIRRNNKRLKNGEESKGDEKITYISNKKSKKIEMRCRRKIKDKVTNMHWHVIKYLTEKYETIVIGNMSTKSIVSNKNSVINAITKKMVYALSFYEFKMRLKGKCKERGNKYEEIDEKYTSKTCSLCGDYKEDLKGEKKYNCKGCGVTMDRDVNGSRNILMKALK
jgi:putative transposase